MKRPCWCCAGAGFHVLTVEPCPAGQYDDADIDGETTTCLACDGYGIEVAPTFPATTVAL